MNKLAFGSNVAATDPIGPIGEVIKIIVNGSQPQELALARVCHTRAPGHAVTLAREAALDGVERVIVVGGDGTINEVVRGLMSVDRGLRPALGIVAHGTSNDFANSAGISMDVGLALREAMTGTPRSIDVGRLTRRADSHWFLNLATGGVLRGPRSGARTQLVGGLVYTVAGILGLPAMQSATLKVRGESFEWFGAIYAIAIGNGRSAGGGFGLCPDASVVDGELDVTIIPATLGFADVLELIDDRGVAGISAIPRFRSPWIEFEADTHLHLNIDGEPRSISGGRFEVVSRGLEVVLPSSSPLLRSCDRISPWPR